MVYRIIIVHISTSGILHFLKGSDTIMLLEIGFEQWVGYFPLINIGIHICTGCFIVFICSNFCHGAPDGN